MKRIRPGILTRLKAGAKAGAGLGVAAASLAGVAFSALGWVGLPILEVVVGSGTLVGLGAAFLRGRQTYIPSLVLDELGVDRACKATRVTAAELKEACDLTKPHYKQEYVDYTIAEKWRRKNPEAFVKIENEHGQLCSCFSFIAMTDSCFDEFIKGRIKDAQFEEDDILSPDETRRSNRLYVAGVIVSEAGTFVGHKRASMMSCAMLKYYKSYFGLKRKRTVYALAVSKEGEKLLQAMDFRRTGSGKRADECDLYAAEIDSSAWNSMMAKVPDWSRGCTFAL
jgi:hypothetical protein